MRGRRSLFTQTDIWPGFTDAISSMLLVLIFVLTVYAVMEAGLSKILGGKEEAIVRLEVQISELRDLLGRTRDRAKELERKAEMLALELALSRETESGAVTEAEEAVAKLTLSEAKLADLATTLEEYVARVRELAELLKAAEREKQEEELRGQELMASLDDLKAKMEELKKRIGETEEQLADKGLTVSELLVRLEKKEREVEELRELEKYKSEFLASLKDLFADNPNIRIVGDRFIFQAEVLFASGSADINDMGRYELNKFVNAFNRMHKRLPRDLDLNIQVQGHTDTDKIIYSERFQSNWELSTARALQVVKYFISRGVPPSLLSAAGYSEYYPRVAGQSESAKSYNRRIEIKLTTP